MGPPSRFMKLQFSVISELKSKENVKLTNLSLYRWQKFRAIRQNWIKWKLKDLCIPPLLLILITFLREKQAIYDKGVLIMTHYTQHCEHQLASSKPNSPIKDNVITNQVERLKKKKKTQKDRFSVVL